MRNPHRTTYRVTRLRWSWRVSERAENSYGDISSDADRHAVLGTNLALSRLPFMAGYSNLIKEVVELSNNGRDLRRQIAGVHLASGQSQKSNMCGRN